MQKNQMKAKQDIIYSSKHHYENSWFSENIILVSERKMTKQVC